MTKAKGKSRVNYNINIGDRWANWTVIKELGIPESYNKQTLLVECICENKTTKVVDTFKFAKGNDSDLPKSCGCIGDPKVGDIYDNWIVLKNLGPISFEEIKKYEDIKYRSYHKDGKRKCLLQCCCENKTRYILDVYDLIEKRGPTSCGCKRIWPDTGIRRNELTKKYPEALDINKYGGAHSYTIIHGVKDNGRKRNISFSLNLSDLEIFEKFCLNDCFYCGFKPNWPETHNGIDRFDNSKAYIEGNCVPCCFKCNLAKRAETADEFKFRIIKLYNKTILGSEDIWFQNNIELKIGTLVSNGKNAGRRLTDLSKKYPDSYGLVKGSYAASVWDDVKCGIRSIFKSKKLTCDLDPLKSFENYIIQACNYCGLKPQFPHTRNGIDRIDSSKGYTENNCVSCCKFCNYAKGDHLLDDFKTWISLAYIHLDTTGWNIKGLNDC